MELNQKKTSWLVFVFAVSILAAGIAVLHTEETGLGDSDFYWHAALGRYIAEEGRIPDLDIFSWLSVEKGYRETAHSWLGSLTCYAVTLLFTDSWYAALFYIFVSVFITAFLLTSFYGKLFYEHDRRCEYANCLTGTAVALTACVLPIRARPLNFSMVFFILSLRILQESFDDPENRSYILLPVISVLWANLHGGSVPILLAYNCMFFAMSFIRKFNFWGLCEEQGADRLRIRRFGLIALADTGAALVNPYGYKLLIYFFSTNDGTTKKYVSEWAPPHLNDLLIVLPLLAILTVIIISTKEKPLRISSLFPVLAAFIVTAKYSRVAGYLNIAAVIMVCRTVRQYTGDRIPRKLNTLTVRKVNPVICLAAAIILALAAEGAAAGKDNVKLTGDVIDRDVAAVLDRIKPRRMYNDYNTGGYLIFHGYKSFIDSRADPFDSKELEKAIQVSRLSGVTPESLENYIADYGFDAMMVGTDYPIYIFLSESSRWKEIYKDGNLAIFIQ